MEETIINVWKPIAFEGTWFVPDISILQSLAPSWYQYKTELQTGNEGYDEFLNRLKRQHAIETGVVEKLYEMSDGITETFIKDGFVESHIGTGDTNIPAGQLMGYLNDHSQAIDFVFDVVKKERPFTKHFLLELHQLITRHQDTTDAIDSLGRYVKIPLLKGQFKEQENNPRRADGKKYYYCPPIQTESEVDKLIHTHNQLWEDNTHPIIIATWVHHAFTQIHPFQDGNGRIARLLASLILIRGNLFPFTIRRTEKSTYIAALEAADEGDPQPLITLFCKIQKGNIEEALNLRTEVKTSQGISDIAKLFRDKVEKTQSQRAKELREKLDDNRNRVFDEVEIILEKYKKELRSEIPIEMVRIGLLAVRPDDDRQHFHTFEIGQYATANKYYFNRDFPRGWFSLSFDLGEEKKYDLIITIHHISNVLDVVALGAFLKMYEPDEETPEVTHKKSIPIELKPYTLSLESDIQANLPNLTAYLNDVVKVSLGIVMNQIS